MSPAAGAAAPATGIITLGAIQPAENGRWQRPAEIITLCDPDPNAEGCHLNGFALATPPWPTLKVDGPGGTPLAFSIAEILPASAPSPAIARVRLTGMPELLNMVRSGDRDLSPGTRAAVVVESRRLGGAGAGADVTVRLGVDAAGDGWRYRGGPMKAGAPFTLTTARYVVTGTVIDVSTEPSGGAK